MFSQKDSNGINRTDMRNGLYIALIIFLGLMIIGLICFGFFRFRKLYKNKTLCNCCKHNNNSNNNKKGDTVSNLQELDFMNVNNSKDFVFEKDSQYDYPTQQIAPTSLPSLPNQVMDNE